MHRLVGRERPAAHPECRIASTGHSPRAGTAGPGTGTPPVWGPHVGRKSTAKANAELGPYLAVPAARLRELQALGQAVGICKF